MKGNTSYTNEEKKPKTKSFFTNLMQTNIFNELFVFSICYLFVCKNVSSGRQNS